METTNENITWADINKELAALKAEMDSIAEITTAREAKPKPVIDKESIDWLAWKDKLDLLRREWEVKRQAIYKSPEWAEDHKIRLAARLAPQEYQALIDLFGEWEAALSEWDSMVAKQVKDLQRQPEEELLYQTVYASSITRIDTLLRVYATNLPALLPEVERLLAVAGQADGLCWVEYGKLRLTEIAQTTNDSLSQNAIIRLEGLIDEWAAAHVPPAVKEAQVNSLYGQEMRKCYIRLYDETLGSPYQALRWKQEILRAEEQAK